MKAIRTFAWLLPSVVASSVWSGCAHSSTAAAAAPATASSTAPDGRGERHAERRTDPADALLGATDGMVLRDEQKTAIRSLDQKLEASRMEVGGAFKKLTGDLAAQVRTGIVDQSEVQADESAVSAAIQAHVAKEHETLDDLHATLDPLQRKAAVAVVRAEQPGRTNMQGAAAPRDDVAKRLERLTHDLDLDATQQQQVAALLGSQPSPRQYPAGERQYRVDALLSAFEADDFDAGTALPPPPVAPADMVREGTDREVAFLSKLLPILRPEQRDKLAAVMERGRPMQGQEH